MSWSRTWTIGLLLSLHPSWSAAQAPGDLLGRLDESMAAAEASLRDGERQVAESHYRDALEEGWLLLGGIAAAEGRFDAARSAYERASGATVEPLRAFQALALVHLYVNEPDDAVKLLVRLVGTYPSDITSRRMLAQALVASGQAKEAVQELEETLAISPDDPELKFALASGYLRLKKVDAAERLFAQIADARPIPQTHVLIGRTYRDAGLYDSARVSLQKALKLDPATRRAHYYLGTVAVMEEGIVRLDEAIEEFERELELEPEDPVASLRLGMALLVAQRPEEALPPLERAARPDSASADASYYLGRCQLALGRPGDAVVSLRRSLERSRGLPDDESQIIRIRNIHYQLGLALRQLGSDDEAANHFSKAERASATRADVARDELTRYLTDAPDPNAAGTRPPLEVSFPLATLPAPTRGELQRRVSRVVAQAYLNLGIMRAQAERFDRAVEFLERAASVDPALPQVQYSLGVARFNAKQYDKAAAPLERALAADPNNDDSRRMLALAWLNSGAFERAAELLRNDPRRERDPSLQYAFGLALARSNRPADAEIVFSQLLAEHGDSPDLLVVLGQAHAQQGDFESAVASLTRALELKPDVREANAALGVIYLRQGRLSEAAEALRAELARTPDDVRSRYNLATVLDLQGQQDEALSLLRVILRNLPDHADARYLLGKIMLARGASVEAAEHLEVAARLSPEDANIHYQLGQAYQKLGRAELAEREFDVFRRLKDKQGGRTQ